MELDNYHYTVCSHFIINDVLKIKHFTWKNRPFVENYWLSILSTHPYSPHHPIPSAAAPSSSPQSIATLPLGSSVDESRRMERKKSLRWCRSPILSIKSLLLCNAEISIFSQSQRNESRCSIDTSTMQSKLEPRFLLLLILSAWQPRLLLYCLAIGHSFFTRPISCFRQVNQHIFTF